MKNAERSSVEPILPTVAAQLSLGLCLLFSLSHPAVCAAQKAPPPNPSDYVGADTCSDCHFAQFQQLQKTAMSAILSNKYPVEQRGCEACHGPGRIHAEAERIKEGRAEVMTEAEKAKAASMTEDQKSKEAEDSRRTVGMSRRSPKNIAAVCLVCHQKDEKKHLFMRSRHLTAGVSCADCHDPHRLNVSEVAKPGAALESYFSLPQRSGERDWLNNRLLRENQPQLCFSCHQDVQAEFQLPVRHRVNEGLVKCTDCHNPHGTLTARELMGVGTEACFTCHVEKRGPFVYEHASVLVEGCTACHTPHGSINLHLLKRRQERQLCLECHTAPQAINVPHPRLGFQTTGECTRCHIEIHGSNYQPQFLR